MGYSVWQLVDAFIQTGEFDDALALLDQHIDQNPADAQALGTRGEIHLRLGQLERAIGDFRALSHPTPDQSIYHAVALKRLGIFGSALDVLTDAFSRWEGEKTSGYHRLLDCFVDIAITQGDAIYLQRALDQLATVTDGNASIVVRQGEIKQLLGDYHGAIAHYSQAIDLISPQVSPSHYLASVVGSWLCGRAGCYRAIGDDRSALADYLKAEILMPDDRAIAMNRAVVAGDMALMRSIWTNATEKERGLMASITPDAIRKGEG